MAFGDNDKAASITYRCLSVVHFVGRCNAFEAVKHCPRLVPPIMSAINETTNEGKLEAEGSVIMTTQVGTDGPTTLSRMNLSGYVGHVTIFS